jgi:glycosyltransferase involved in cell wall biosynthesis
MAHIGVLSSESEGLPVALLEYGMAALPTIATQVGQCSQVLWHGKYGWVVPPKSPIPLALAIEEIILHPKKARIISKDFENQIRKNYGPKNFMIEYEKIISHLNNISRNKLKVV